MGTNQSVFWEDPKVAVFLGLLCLAYGIIVLIRQEARSRWGGRISRSENPLGYWLRVLILMGMGVYLMVRGLRFLN